MRIRGVLKAASCKRILIPCMLVLTDPLVPEGVDGETMTMTVIVSRNGVTGCNVEAEGVEYEQGREEGLGDWVEQNASESERNFQVTRRPSEFG